MSFTFHRPICITTSRIYSLILHESLPCTYLPRSAMPSSHSFIDMSSQYWGSSASETTACELQTLGAPSSPSSSDDVDIFSRQEKEARTVLRTSTNVNEIQLVCSLFPFRDPDVRFEILSGRWSPRLDVFLRSLPTKDHDSKHHSIGELNQHKAEEILRRTAPDLPTSPIWNWQWSPPIESSTIKAAQIADIINREMSEAFSKVAFTALVRGACGYQTDAVTELIDGVVHTRRELCRRFQELHQSKNEYEVVEKVRTIKSRKSVV